MSDEQSGSERSAVADGGRLGLLLLLIFSLPVAVMLAGFLLLGFMGVEEARALSLSGLGAASIAAPWGVIVAIKRWDTKVTGEAATPAGGAQAG